MQCWAVHVLEAPFAVHDDIGRLSTIEMRWHLAVLLLTFVTAAGGLTLAGGGTSTSADALVVG